VRGVVVVNGDRQNGNVVFQAGNVALNTAEITLHGDQCTRNRGDIFIGAGLFLSHGDNFAVQFFQPLPNHFERNFAHARMLTRNP